MPKLTDLDRKRIEEVRAALTVPDPPKWNPTVVYRINDLSNETLVGAIEKGESLTLGCDEKRSS